jgi:hypothetical protein
MKISLIISKEDGKITHNPEYTRNEELVDEEEVAEMWDRYLLQCGRVFDVLPIVERRLDRCPPERMPQIEVGWILEGLQRVSTSAEGGSRHWPAKAQRIAGAIALARGDKEGAVMHFKQALAFDQKAGVAKLLRRLQHE